jgi:hypothetical protein
MNNNNIVIYQSEDGKVHLDVVYNEETMWLTQQQLCELYQTSKSNVSEHIKHILEEGELYAARAFLLNCSEFPNNCS